MAEEAQKEQSTIKEIEVRGYKFNVDTDLLDDVDSLAFIDQIENKGHVATVLPLLVHIMGKEEFEKLKAHFMSADAEDHKDQKDYKPRMRIEVMNETYMAIIDKFDPKG